MTQPYPSYPQPTYPGPATPMQPAAVIKSKTWPLVLLIAGIVAGMVAVAMGVGSVASMLKRGELTELNPAGTTQMQLDSSALYGLYSVGTASCEVTDSSGNSLPVVSADASQEKAENSMTQDPDTGATLFGMVNAEASGTYAVTCDSPEAAVYMGPVFSMSDSHLGLMGAAVSLGFVGFGLFVAGLIWLIVRVSRNKKARAALAAYSPTQTGWQGTPPGSAPLA